MSRSLTTLLALWPALAFAEGSVDTNAGNPSNPQWLDARSGEPSRGQPGGSLFTQVFVDVLAVGEVITFNHSGNATLVSPTGTTIGTTFANASTHTATTTGAYRVEYDRDQSSWDISVSGTATNQGRVWSRAWHFDAETFNEPDATFASFYALVEGGDAGHDGVVQMRTDGMAGYLYLITANRFGMTNANGRSVPQGTEFPSVPVEYRVYLRPPENANYNPLAPTITGVGFDYDSALCDQVAEGVSSGAFTFTSDVEGTFHIVCDLGGPGGVPDDVFDFTSDVDLHLIGETGAQSQRIFWDGTDNLGDPVDPGTYDCQAFVTVGEFHYVGGDIETTFPGFRLFEVLPPTPAITRDGLPMYWNDELVQGNDTYMPSPPAPASTTGLVRSGPGGIDSGNYGDAAVPNVNARSWGNFNTNPTAINPTPCGQAPPLECSKGDWGWLDTYTWLRESPRIAFQVTVGSLDDGDLDTLLDAEEECLFDTDPTLPDTDGDGLDDDVEVHDLPTDPNNPDSDGDGIDDGTEVGDDPSVPLNFDNDTLIDAMDPDDDNDGIPTIIENGYPEGPDSDDAPNHLDLDSDGDGIPDATEGNVHSDDDLVPDFLDLDSDNDSLLDSVEGTTDTDGDGLADFRDPDDDNDTIPTIDEVGEGDTDGDLIPDYLDDDDDNDGIPTAVEVSYADADTDGDPNHQDLDSDADGIPDAIEGNVHSDDDSLPDFLDTDSDNDTLLDSAEGTVDTDGDGLADFRDPDDDNDTIPTADEASRGDTDGDGLSDHLDPDDDDDGILTATEAADAADYGEGGTDVDEDGDDNWYDTDADGDGELDGVDEGRDDTDRDGVLDYLDPDGEYFVDYSGSCLLSTGGPAPTGLLAGALALAAAIGARRRRGVGVALAALIAGVFAVGTAHAGDAPEISRVTGRPGQVVILWPRVIPADPTDEIRFVAGALQDRLVALVESGSPDLVRSVRPEPERVCPRGTGCKAPSVGALLAYNQQGCAVVGWVSEPGKGPARLVPLAGRLDLKDDESPFREPPESLVTIRDFAECSTVVESLDPAGVAKLQEMLRAAQ